MIVGGNKCCYSQLMKVPGDLPGRAEAGITGKVFIPQGRFQIGNDEIGICPIRSDVLETFLVLVVFFRWFVSAVYLRKVLDDVPAKQEGQCL